MNAKVSVILTCMSHELMKYSDRVYDLIPREINWDKNNKERVIILEIFRRHSNGFKLLGELLSTRPTLNKVEVMHLSRSLCTDALSLLYFDSFVSDNDFTALENEFNVLTKEFYSSLREFSQYIFEINEYHHNEVDQQERERIERVLENFDQSNREFHNSSNPKIVNDRNYFSFRHNGGMLSEKSKFKRICLVGGYSSEELKGLMQLIKYTSQFHHYNPATYGLSSEWSEDECFYFYIGILECAKSMYTIFDLTEIGGNEMFNQILNEMNNPIVEVFK